MATPNHPVMGRFTPSNAEAQPKAKQPTTCGQESTFGLQGQSTTGRKVEGQVANAGRVVAGQSTAPRHPSRPNR
jgi:hypothetical protein